MLRARSRRPPPPTPGPGTLPWTCWRHTLPVGRRGATAALVVAFAPRTVRRTADRARGGALYCVPAVRVASSAAATHVRTRLLRPAWLCEASVAPALQRSGGGWGSVWRGREGVVARLLTPPAAYHRMFAGRLSARACSAASLRCHARQMVTSAVQPRRGTRTASHRTCDRMASCWDVAAAGTCQHVLVRWAQHTRCHRPLGRSLRLSAATASSQAASTCRRVVTARHLHRASGDSSNQPGAKAPAGQTFRLFSSGQLHTFVKRYGPVALGTTRAATRHATPQSLLM